MKEMSWLTKLIENTPLAVIAIGVLTFFTAAAGEWPYPKL